jgi:hypothetical protein
MKVRSQMTMVAQMGIDGERETVTPPIVHTLALEVRSVDADGTATVDFEVMNSKVLPDKEAAASVRDKLEAAVSSIRGMTGTYRVDAQGIVKDFEIDKSAQGRQLDRSMAEAIGEFLHRSTAPVPKEAVGTGGTWTVERRLTEGQIVTDQTSRYELRRIDGSKITVDIKTEKTAPFQEVGTPGTYGHYEVKLFAAKGEGKLEADLGRLVPQLAASNTDAELKTFMQKKDGLPLSMDLVTNVRERITGP